MSSYAGDWQTTFGPMTLTQEADRVRGSYFYMGLECFIEGTAVQGKLTFSYREPTVQGEGWFELKRSGKGFAGEFRPEGSERWEAWTGDRMGFDGLWNSTFGLLRLIEEDEGHVRGFYEAGGSATIDGQRNGKRLTFRYREPRVRGRGRFELSTDALSFQGEWKPQGETAWKPWSGIRVRPQSKQTWLVVLESPWQRFLSDKEYSFGNMLREFFARVERVQVRHRFFANEAGLRKCCRDLLYIAEPVVLVVASHGLAEGIVVDGQTIGIRALVEDLRPLENIQLLHFSSCLVMQDANVVALLKDFSREAGLPISGYTTSIDWAESAIIEFTLLDLVLSRELKPAAAVEQLRKLLPFVGHDPVPEGVFPPAGFTLVLPDQASGKDGRAVPGKRAKARR